MTMMTTTTNNTSSSIPPSSRGTTNSVGGGGVPPPPRRLAAAAAAATTTAPSASAASASTSTGRTPVAHRTRYMNYQAQQQRAAAGAAATSTRPPPRRININNSTTTTAVAPPPPPTTTRSSTTTATAAASASVPSNIKNISTATSSNAIATTTTTSSSSSSSSSLLQREADDGIAKRRAELRRLQQSRSSHTNLIMNNVNNATASTASVAARSQLLGTTTGIIGNYSSSTVASRQNTRMMPPPANPAKNAGASTTAAAAAANTAMGGPQRVSSTSLPPSSSSLSSSAALPGTSTPVIICSSPRLPSTATITRRLDYDAFDHDNNNNIKVQVGALDLPSSTLSSSSALPPLQHLQQRPPPPQSQSQQPTKILSGGTTGTAGMGMGMGMVSATEDQDGHHWKRTSEIFNVGKQQQHHHQQIQQQQQRTTPTMTGGISHASGSLGGGGAMSLNPCSPSGPERHLPTASTAASTTTTFTTTTAATTSTSTAAAVHNYPPPRNPANANDAPVPPLIMEPLALGKAEQQQQRQSLPPPSATATLHQEQQTKKQKQPLGLPSIIKKSSPPVVVQQQQQQQQQEHTQHQQQEEEVSSGKSTPVMSNLDHLPHDGDGDDRLAKDKLNKLKVGSVTTADDYKGSTKSGKDDQAADDVSRLMIILERNEQEKKIALEKLTNMKQLLLQQKSSTYSTINSSNNNNSTGASTLLDQFKDMVATHGESEAEAWIAQQLDPTVSGNPERGWRGVGGGGGRLSSSRPSSGGGTIMHGDDTNMLLSSIIPPLTPRSRPGSRAASPERGGGGTGGVLGGLIDKHHGDVGMMSSRGKRTTTPLPKQFNKTMTVAGGGRSLEDGDDGFGKGTGGGSGRKKFMVHESIENEYLVKAAMNIPNEYGTLLASYLVRRPYVHGLDERRTSDDASRDEQMWSSYTHLTSKEEYQQCATALDPSSIDIVAYIEADGSVFTLSGRCNARHGRLSSSFANAASASGSFDGERSYEEDAPSYDWVVFDDVEGTDRALGKVTYIDVEGNERDYWLDSIYEEALTTRESYCMSMLSTAFALKEVTGGGSFIMSSARERQGQQRPNQQHPTTTLHPNESMHLPPLNAKAENTIHVQQQHQQPPTLTQPVVPSDHVTQAPPPPASVFNVNQTVQQSIPETSKVPRPQLFEQNLADVAPERPTAATSNIQHPPPERKSSVPLTKDDNHAKPTKMQPEEVYEPADSALPILVVTILSMLFSLIWFFVKIPFRIGSTLFSVWVFIVALRVLWLLLADDNGAWEMGAGVDFEYNMPGIY